MKDLSKVPIEDAELLGDMVDEIGKSLSRIKSATIEDLGRAEEFLNIICNKLGISERMYPDWPTPKRYHTRAMKKVNPDNMAIINIKYAERLHPVEFDRQARAILVGNSNFKHVAEGLPYDKMYSNYSQHIREKKFKSHQVYGRVESNE